MSHETNQLKLSNISCERQENILFKNLDLTANSGDLIRILGKNGSGKSSLLKIIIGLLKPVSGNVSWNNQDIHPYRSEFVKQLTYIGHKAAVKTELTVMENISALLGYTHRQEDTQDIIEALESLELSRYRDVQAGYLSQGQQRRIALTRLWLEQTGLWVLDEPYTALDSQAISLVNGIIDKAINKGTIVIFTSHQQTFDPNQHVINVSLSNASC